MSHIRQSDVFLILTSLLMVILIAGHNRWSGDFYSTVVGVIGVAWISSVLIALVIDNRRKIDTTA